MITNATSTPRWAIAVIIIALLPVIQFPMLLITCKAIGMIKTLLWFYPFYCLVAAFLAYVSYGQRRAVSWILIALMLLSHIAMWTLANTPLELIDSAL